MAWDTPGGGGGGARSYRRVPTPVRQKRLGMGTRKRWNRRHRLQSREYQRGLGLCRTNPLESQLRYGGGAGALRFAAREPAARGRATKMKALRSFRIRGPQVM